MRNLILSFSLIITIYSGVAYPVTKDTPVAYANADTTGAFGNLLNWPIIPIHIIFQPNGEVLSYGTNESGLQGAFIHDLWSPSQGVDIDAHQVLPNIVKTDLFCSGQAIISSTGNTLIIGGDYTLNGVRNYANQDTNIFDSRTNQITSGTPMDFKRWYPTLLTLANGETLILGGRASIKKNTYAPTPEIYSSTSGFRVLTNAISDIAYGSRTLSWYYPRAFQAPNGKVYIASHLGKQFYLDTAGTGLLSLASDEILPLSSKSLPSVMYAPGKILSLREGAVAITIDLNTAKPTVQTTAPLSQLRYWSNATVLADGQILVNGGSAIDKSLVGLAQQVELWNPLTGKWTLGATASKPRLYHSVALLLPDATVLTGGGGAPGPVKNLNAEIYYPPYLFKKDGTGQLAVRPIISNSPDISSWKNTEILTLYKSEQISKANLVRAGSATHAFNPEQRFIPLNFSQTAGNQIAVTMPDNGNIAPPGYYFLFVFNQSGTPSVAKIIHIR
jgi:Domain of unknown function (DUF1929)